MKLYIHDFGFWLIFGPQEVLQFISFMNRIENFCVHTDKKDTMVSTRVMPRPAVHDFSIDCQGIYILLKSTEFAGEYPLPGRGVQWSNF
jgi:hypothetical protein